MSSWHCFLNECRGKPAHQARWGLAVGMSHLRCHGYTASSFVCLPLARSLITEPFWDGLNKSCGSMWIADFGANKAFIQRTQCRGWMFHLSCNEGKNKRRMKRRKWMEAERLFLTVQWLKYFNLKNVSFISVSLKMSLLRCELRKFTLCLE